MIKQKPSVYIWFYMYIYDCNVIWCNIQIWIGSVDMIMDHKWWMDILRIVTSFVASPWSTGASSNLGAHMMWDGHVQGMKDPLDQQFPLIQKWVWGARYGWAWVFSPNCKMAPVFAAMWIKWASDRADGLWWLIVVDLISASGVQTSWQEPPSVFKQLNQIEVFRVACSELPS